MPPRDRGFALIEILVALLILALGLTAAAAGIAVAERVEWQAGARMTAAIALANRVAELRAIAGRTTPRCLDLGSGSGGVPPGPVESWDVTGAGAQRRVMLRVRLTGRGQVTDSVELILRCA